MKNILNMVLVFMFVWMVAKWEYHNPDVKYYSVEYGKPNKKGKVKKWKKATRTLPEVHSAVFRVKKKKAYKYRVVAKMETGKKKISNVLFYKFR